jgi:phosphatidylserine/phosphatidylglycerophosphate/cardiolipin synthase-like enzyme
MLTDEQTGLRQIEVIRALSGQERLRVDKSQRTEKYSSADFVAHAGIPTYIDAKHAIAHNKIMVIDGYEILTGSFNFTKAAEENNAENLLVILDASRRRSKMNLTKAVIAT